MLSTNRTLLFRYLCWFLSLNVLLFWLAGFPYLKAILSSGTLFANTLAAYSGFFGKSFVLLFAFVTYLSYMALWAFAPILLLAPLVLLFSRRRLLFAASVILSTLNALVLLVDLATWSMFKFHLNMSIVHAVFIPKIWNFLDLSLREGIDMVLIIIVVFVVEIILARVIWKKIVLPARWFVGNTPLYLWLSGAVFTFVSLVISIGSGNNLLMQQTPNLPYFSTVFAFLIPDQDANDILKRYGETLYSLPMHANDPLNYPRHPLRACSAKKPYNIILIMVDSLRFDSIRESRMPNMTRFAADNWHFLQHLSGGNATQPGLFSLFYSIPGSYWTAAYEQKKPPVLISLLQQYHYQTKVLWSSTMRGPSFDKTIYLGLDDLLVDGTQQDDIGDADRMITRQAMQFLQSRKRDKPLFLNLFYDAPHAFCRDQSYAPIHPGPMAACSRVFNPAEMDVRLLLERYLNSVHFVDEQIALLLQTIKDKGYLDDSIVIMTSDHGQEFDDNQNNFIGHSSNFTQFQQQVPLIIHWPGQSARQFDYMTSSYDVVPTLVENLFSCSNPVSDYSVGQNLLKKEGRLPFLIVGSYVNMGVIEPDRIMTLRTSGPIEITDKKGHALANSKPRMDVLKQAVALMRYYFTE